MSGLTIEKLVGRKNYSTWKISAQAYLELDDLWTTTIDYEVAANGTPVTAVDANKDRKAKSKLILSIDPVCFVHIQESKTAREVWTKLSEAYEDSGLTRRVGLLRKLITTSLTNCGSMEVYVNEIITTSHALTSIGFAISEEWIAALLLAGLPDEYRPMIMAMENSGLKLTGDVVKTKLLQEMRPVELESEGVFLAKHKKKYSKNFTKGPRKGSGCWKCGSDNHLQKDCKSKKGNPGRSEGAFNVVLSTVGECSDYDWFFDSGATSHMVKNKALITNETPMSNFVMAADKKVMKVETVGVAELKPARGNERKPIPVQDVLYIPELSANLLSVSKIVKKGYTMTFSSKGCEVRDADGKMTATGSLVGDLFKFDQSVQSEVLACKEVLTYDLWHRRMGHLNPISIKKLQSQCATGIQFKDGNNVKDCRVCPLGKQSRLPFSKNGSRAKELLEIVHSDVCGPMNKLSLGSRKYFITFIDDFSRKIFIYFLATKTESEVQEKFLEFKAFAENKTGKKIKTLRTDNGKEYTNHTLERLLKREGIQHQLTNPHTPEQNGLSERNNRTIIEKVRCMLFDAGLAKCYWAEAAAYAVYLLNRSPASGVGVTPEEVWTGRKPDLSHIRVFGCTAMAHIPKACRKKLDAKATECILTGFDENTKGYRLYDPKAKKFFKSRDVSFIDENAFKSNSIVEPREAKMHELVLDQDEEPSINPLFEDEDSIDIQVGDEFVAAPELPALPVSDQNSTALPQQNNSNPPLTQALRRGERERKPTGKFKDFICQNPRLSSYTSSQAGSDDDDDGTQSTEEQSTVERQEMAGFVAPPLQNYKPAADMKQQGLTLSDRGRSLQGKYLKSENPEKTNTPRDILQPMDDPITVKEAMSRPDGGLWRMAMQSEYEALMDNNTWDLVDLPLGRKAIKTKWVFRTKKDVTGQIDRYKARLVCKGYTQRKGEDFDETYSPVVRHSSLRYLFALAVQYDLVIEQMDAITAFLQGDLNEEIYVEQPCSFEDKSEPRKVCRLKKALYGLKQSSRVWNDRFDKSLKSLGLHQSEYDPCMYFKIVNGKIFILALYVDDILIFTNCMAMLKFFKEELCKMFKMKELGEAKQCLGIRITRSKDTLALDQQQYIENILERFGMTDAKPVATPLNPSEKLTKEFCPRNDEEKAKMAKIPYQEAVGCLNYLAQSTRPDIAFAVHVLSRFNSNAGEKHWQAVKHLLRYLRGTSNHRLEYRKSIDGSITGYSDADWASDTDGRKSVTGYVFIAQGGAISWASKKQQAVAISTCEAEYYALSGAVQEAIWWKGLKSQLTKEETLQVCCDNQSTIAVAESKGFHSKAKHIDIRYNFVKDAIGRETIKLAYIESQHQPADLLTKPLDRLKVYKLRETMGIRNNEVEEEC